MKYCSNCGKESADEAVVCVGCGVALYSVKNSENDQKSLGYAVLSFFVPVVGLVLWLVWKDETPLRAKSVGQGALISVILVIVWYVLIFALGFGNALLG